MIDKAQVCVEKPEPEQAHRNVGDQPGNQKQGPNYRGSGKPVHERRKAESQNSLRADVDDDVVRGDPKRIPELLVVDESRVVLGANEVGRAQQVVVGQ